VCADPNDLIPEQRDDNNCRTLDFSVEDPTPPLPDLNPHSVSGPSDVSPGDDVTVSWRTKNEGDKDAPAGWSAGIYLSDDSRIGDSDDILLGTTSFNLVLSPNKETIESKRVTIPNWVEAGDYYYGVIADY
jgi:hypothetical protein